MRVPAALANAESCPEGHAANAEELFLRHNCRDVKRRVEEIPNAVCATYDQAVIQSTVLMAQATVRLIQRVQQDISECEERIDRLAKAHPDFAIFDSLPGAGEALVPRLIAALGTQRDRFSSAI